MGGWESGEWGADEAGTRGKWDVELRAAPPSPSEAADSDGTPGQGPPAQSRPSALDRAQDKGSFSPHLDQRLWAEPGAVSTPHPTSGSAAPGGAGGSVHPPPHIWTRSSGRGWGSAPPPHLDPQQGSCRPRQHSGGGRSGQSPPQPSGLLGAQPPRRSRPSRGPACTGTARREGEGARGALDKVPAGGLTLEMAMVK